MQLLLSRLVVVVAPLAPNAVYRHLQPWRSRCKHLPGTVLVKGAKGSYAIEHYSFWPCSAMHARY